MNNILTIVIIIIKPGSVIVQNETVFIYYDMKYYFITNLFEKFIITISIITVENCYSKIIYVF